VNSSKQRDPFADQVKLALDATEILYESGLGVPLNDSCLLAWQKVERKHVSRG
jgi:hypothetical protein